MLRRAVARGINLFQPTRLRRFEQVSRSVEQLGRLDDLGSVISRCEAIACDLLPCDGARITLSAADGASAWVETLRMALPAPGGGRVGWMIAGRDRGPAFSADDEAVFEHLARAVTLAVRMGQRTAERDEAVARAGMLLSRMSEGVAEFDRRLRFLSINEAGARAWLVADPSDIGAMSLWDFGPGGGAGQFGALCQAAIETDMPVWATARFLALQRFFELRAFPNPKGLTVLFRDVTAERDADARLRHSRRLEAVGQLTGGVAHDVSNLLTVMLGNFETLAARAEERIASPPTPPKDELESDLSLAIAGLRAGESATSLIQRLLTYSRGKPESIAATDVVKLLRSLEPLLQRTLGRRILARVICPEDLWPALADPAELESTVLNLALNAHDAMPGGGVLDIAAENVEVDRLYAKIGGFEQTGSFVMLSVIDNGAGMSEDTMQRAFDPFFTTKADGKGSGLGLSMVRGFAHQVGGHVLIDSEPGQGTILRVYLPRAPAAAASSPETSAPQEPVRRPLAGGGEQVLLVEDNALVRGHGEATLHALGYRVTAAADGAEAVQLLRDGLAPALLFTDVTLAGGMNGPELARVARDLLPKLAVLYTSGYGGNALLRDGRLMPGVSLLKKPFRRSDLAAAVRAEIDGAP